MVMVVINSNMENFLVFMWIAFIAIQIYAYIGWSNLEHSVWELEKEPIKRNKKWSNTK